MSACRDSGQLYPRTGFRFSLMQATDGNFYGTTTSGGTNNLGTVYKITPSGILTTLYSFDGTHGSDPVAGLIQAIDGNFYGTTEGGGTDGEGVVYKVTSTGNLTVLVNFRLDGLNGQQPVGPLVQATDGNLYGTTATGGTNDSGVIFRMTSTGKLIVLHNLNGTTDGMEPFAGLLQASDGNLYGTAQSGGTTNNGTLFKLSTKTVPVYGSL